MFPRDMNSFLLARKDGEDHDGRNERARAVAVEERNSLAANSGAFLALLVDARSQCGHGYLLGGDGLVEGGGDDMAGEAWGGRRRWDVRRNGGASGAAQCQHGSIDDASGERSQRDCNGAAGARREVAKGGQLSLLIRPEMVF